MQESRLIDQRIRLCLIKLSFCLFWYHMIGNEPVTIDHMESGLVSNATTLSLINASVSLVACACTCKKICGHDPNAYRIKK